MSGKGIDFIGRIRWIWIRANQIFALVNSILVLTETGGTLTADGAVQTVCINETPLGVFKPKKVMIDCSNMALLDVTTVRVYKRIIAGGALTLVDEEEYSGPQDIALLTPMKVIDLGENRFGFSVTLEQSAGTNRDYVWEYIYKD